VLTATRKDGEIQLDFPATVPTEAPPPDGLLDALGTSAEFTGRSKFDALVVVGNEQTVRSLQPDFRRLKQVQVRGVIVTGPSDDARFDFVSRFFAPTCGIDEDPVTGSAHCALGPYWAQRLGKAELTAYQASRRGGIVRVAVRGDRVHLRGQAVTILRGELV
jgi:PhzF family phenazine biosynthesis protein